MTSKTSELLHDNDLPEPRAARPSLDADLDENEGPDLDESDLDETITLIEAEEEGGEEGPETADLEEGELEAQELEIVELEEEVPEDVEVSLDEFLREQLEGEGIEYEEEEEHPVLVAPGEAEEPRPRAADEFVCQSCFLIKNRRQLADSSRSICKDCANPR